jgi:AraC family transcriptional regulator, positive regulator of tynA and feaB
MTIYDATRPHRIFCPGRFSKLILSIPRSGLRERIVGVEHCSALRIPGNRGVGAVTAAFLKSCAEQAGDLSAAQIDALSENCLDLLAISLSTVRPAAAAASRGRLAALTRIKHFVERNLADPNLDAATVAAGVGMSTRYVNDILSDEDISLMRYVLGRRLEKCQRDLTSPAGAGILITEVAFRWGFNDLSHFSRSFKEKFGCSPREYKNLTLHLTHRVLK